MADLVIHNVEAGLLEALERQAEAHSVTVEEELRGILQRSVRVQAPEAWAKFANEATALREDLRRKYGLLSDSTKDIAEDRLR